MLPMVGPDGAGVPPPPPPPPVAAPLGFHMWCFMPRLSPLVSVVLPPVQLTLMPVIRPPKGPLPVAPGDLEALQRARRAVLLERGGLQGGGPAAGGVVGRLARVRVGLGHQVRLGAGDAVAAVAGGELGERDRAAALGHHDAARAVHRRRRRLRLEPGDGATGGGHGPTAVDLALGGVADVEGPARPRHRPGVGAGGDGLRLQRVGVEPGGRLPRHDDLQVRVERRGC